MQSYRAESTQPAFYNRKRAQFVHPVALDFQGVGRRLYKRPWLPVSYMVNISAVLVRSFSAGQPLCVGSPNPANLTDYPNILGIDRQEALRIAFLLDIRCKN